MNSDVHCWSWLESTDWGFLLPSVRLRYEQLMTRSLLICGVYWSIDQSKPVGYNWDIKTHIFSHWSRSFHIHSAHWDQMKIASEACFVYLNRFCSAGSVYFCSAHDQISFHFVYIYICVFLTKFDWTRIQWNDERLDERQNQLEY